MIKKTFTINEKNKDLGLLKKVRKQERLRGDFWFWKLFWESWELLGARHEHSISVPDSTSLNHCITDKTLQHIFILILDFFNFKHYTLGPEGARKWEMFVTL